MNTQINTNKNDIAALQTSVAGKAAASHTHDDRYFTETEVTNKLAGKSDVGHTHTKSQITDFPTSLPANGGTADSATNATNDSNGNNIANTYMPKSGGTFKGDVHFNSGIHCNNFYPVNSIGASIIFYKNKNDDGYDIILSSPNGIVNIPSTITPRKGTIDGNTVSIGRSDGNITIGDTNNNNAGFTVINNDCEMLKSLNVSGDVLSSFKGGCDFGDICAFKIFIS